MILKSILENLKERKIGVYVRDLGQYGYIEGILKEISEEIIILKAKYNDLIYISITEIIGVREKKTRKLL